ncbi:MAG TPA: NAD-dependent deacylase [Solibacterales bacterium]|nr:NAD-dependent deacylase [Bryobacterales bacterium]
MEQAREWLRQAESVVALTGAGVSAESGIPTFRGAGGLWRNYRPEDLATPQAFARDPRLVREWYEWRRDLIANAQPNPAHIALAELERRTPRFALVTQNVDDLHERAGSRRVLKLHGDIATERCQRCGREQPRVRSVELPQCGCGGLLRPAVVWFGEALPAEVWRRAEEAVAAAQVVLVVGTSAVVYPAASLVPAAVEAGARVIEVNLEETPFSAGVSVSLRGKAGEILPQVLELE